MLMPTSHHARAPDATCTSCTTRRAMRRDVRCSCKEPFWVSLRSRKHTARRRQHSVSLVPVCGTGISRCARFKLEALGSTRLAQTEQILRSHHRCSFAHSYPLRSIHSSDGCDVLLTAQVATLSGAARAQVTSVCLGRRHRYCCAPTQVRLAVPRAAHAEVENASGPIGICSGCMIAQCSRFPC
jgi:hypothetical protein